MLALVALRPGLARLGRRATLARREGLLIYVMAGLVWGLWSLARGETPGGYIIYFG